MQRLISRNIRNWFAVAMALVLVGSLLGWFFTRPSLPRTIRIGTAVEGGLYDEEGRRVAESLETRVSSEVTVVKTSGSLENAQKLRSGELEVGLIQAGTTSLKGLAIVTPLHRDVVHVIVRRQPLAGEQSVAIAQHITDLAGKKIAIGLPESGMQASARQILSHYHLMERITPCDVHFTALLDEESDCDAAIVTTGLENDDVRQLLDSGIFEILPLDAKALAMRYRHFDTCEIPTNLWAPYPAQPIPTVCASALVVVPEDSSSELVTLLLDSIFEDNLPDEFATMFLSSEAQAMAPARLHPVTRQYYDPFGRYSVLHSILEALAAGKELAMALLAGIYLAWDRWRRIRERETQEQIRIQKQRLDKFLDRTLEIERRQMHVTDAEKLQGYLEAVTDIKLEALDKLTHEDLRGDRTFAIFLMQCANLISKIQLKIMNADDAAAVRNA